jgi:hypothetical protein
MLLLVPPVLVYFLRNALTPGDSGDDDWGKLAGHLIDQEIDYLMGTMVLVRELTEAVKTLRGTDNPHDYQGPVGVRMLVDIQRFSAQANQGEFDDSFRKAAVNLVGDMFGLPSAQINRTITGAEKLQEGETANPASLVFGFQKPH